MVYDGPFVFLAYYSYWDVTRDGRRLLILQSEGTAEEAKPAPPQINIVLNWFEDLKQRAPMEASCSPPGAASGESCP